MSPTEEFLYDLNSIIWWLQMNPLFGLMALVLVMALLALMILSVCKLWKSLKEPCRVAAQEMMEQRAAAAAPAKNPLIVGIRGYKRSGKDRFAQMLMQELEHYSCTGATIAFADKIKYMILAMGIATEEQLWGSDVDRDAVFIPELGCSLRLLLETLGTEWGRNMVNSNIWINLLLKNKPDADIILVTDVRFGNEAQKIRDTGLLYVITGRGEPGEHGSEAEIEVAATDHVVDNSSTLEHLRSQARTIARQLVEEHGACN